MHEKLTSKIRVLCVDDDPNVTWILSDGLNAEEFIVETCNDGRAAVNKLSGFKPDVCLLDIKMPGMDGIQLLNYIKRQDPGISVIMISGHADTPIVVQAVQGGADDFIVKPFDVEMVEICIQKVIEKKDLKQRVQRLESELARQSLWENFIGESPAFLRVRELIEQISTTDLNVLIRGESGTGKDIVARMIHQLSDRARGPFVKVNCAALPPELLESELFGHERGAFTGAYRSKPGRFELANKGTIFLDEIGEMAAPVQATLLQVLEHKEFFRVGGTQSVKVDVRLITATNIDIEKHIQEKKFRLDLFYRINDLTVHMPALRERGDDMILLAHHFLEKYGGKFGKGTIDLGQEAERALLQYHWPGNVRELESLIKRAVIFGGGEILKHIERHKDDRAGASESTDGDPFNPEELPTSYFENKTLKEISEGILSQIERRAIKMCLDRQGWNRKKTARDLGISYRCLLYKIQQYDLQKDTVTADSE
ncbi:MAG TPA: sigma-54 dependent transcriptional regulator [Candidatus Sumerlaeota bacterium]|nr:MAG: Nitrogen regulation protein NR(I) [candidate division BRC1 bacterium ADurb.BinA292]HOE95327.1 sigma-54 dependent transcriptional regulator [Candidatus Sumerlaeota bacterium]HPK02486.1 sigma-54 dependent transcriptional regulator [Candidatus Sumerlaeota bacterium]